MRLIILVLAFSFGLYCFGFVGGKEKAGKLFSKVFIEFEDDECVYDVGENVEHLNQTQHGVT